MAFLKVMHTTRFLQHDSRCLKSALLYMDLAVSAQ